MKKTLLLLLAALPMAMAAQNPIIRNLYTADPTARVFNGKVYLYPSHDILPPAGQRQDCSAWKTITSSHRKTSPTGPTTA